MAVADPHQNQCYSWPACLPYTSYTFIISANASNHIGLSSFASVSSSKNQTHFWILPKGILAVQNHRLILDITQDCFYQSSCDRTCCGERFGLVWSSLVLVWFDLVWSGLVWSGLPWFVLVLVWFGLVWSDLVWFGLIWSGLVWFDLVWSGLVWFDLV